MVSILPERYFSFKEFLYSPKKEIFKYEKIRSELSKIIINVADVYKGTIVGLKLKNYCKTI